MLRGLACFTASPSNTERTYSTDRAVTVWCLSFEYTWDTNLHSWWSALARTVQLCSFNIPLAIDSISYCNGSKNRHSKKSDRGQGRQASKRGQNLFAHISKGFTRTCFSYNSVSQLPLCQRLALQSGLQAGSLVWFYVYLQWICVFFGLSPWIGMEPWNFNLKSCKQPVSILRPSVLPAIIWGPHYSITRPTLSCYTSLIVPMWLLYTGNFLRSCQQLVAEETCNLATTNWCNSVNVAQTREHTLNTRYAANKMQQLWSRSAANSCKRLNKFNSTNVSAVDKGSGHTDTTTGETLAIWQTSLSLNKVIGDYCSLSSQKLCASGPVTD